MPNSKSAGGGSEVKAGSDAAQPASKRPEDREASLQAFQQAERERKIQGGGRVLPRQPMSSRTDPHFELQRSQSAWENAQRDAHAAQETARNDRSAAIAQAAVNVFMGLSKLDRRSHDFKDKLAELMLANPEVANHPEVAKAVMHDLSVHHTFVEGSRQQEAARALKRFEAVVARLPAEDQTAVAWANANQHDPRAAAIIKLHGG